MPTIPGFDVPTLQILTQMISDFCDEKGYQTQIQNPDPNSMVKLIPNPETKAQFYRRLALDFTKGPWRRAEARRAQQAQQAAVDAAVKAATDAVDNTPIT